MLPMLVRMRVFSPVSSLTSRSATCSTVSPLRGVPLGNAQIPDGLRPTRTTSISPGVASVGAVACGSVSDSAAWPRRKMTPPAEKARCVRYFCMGDFAFLQGYGQTQDMPSDLLNGCYPFLPIDPQDFQQVLLRIEVVRVTLDKFADDGDGMEFEHFDD